VLLTSVEGELVALALVISQGGMNAEEVPM
jgi:hypothetical protein